MKKYIRLELDSPVSLNKDRATENASTRDYIPGSALRGCIAGIYLNRISGGKPDDDFNEIFLEEKVSFCNLYPGGGSPVPKTAVSCKRWKGFLKLNTDNEKHGVFDNLPILALRWCIADKSDRDTLKNVNLTINNYRHCPVCNKYNLSFPLEPFSGYYGYDKSGKPVTFTPDKSIIIRTGINRQTGNVKHGILYGVEVLQPYKKGEAENDFISVAFGGIITFDDENLIPKLDRIINNDFPLRFGVAKTRGLGKTHVNIYEKYKDDTSLTDFKTRLDKLNSVIHRKAEDSNLPVEVYRRYFQNRYFFTIDFQSDAIIHDRFLRYKSNIGQNDIEKLIPGNDIEIIGGITDTFPVSGWNSALGIPKDDEIAIEKGSVILCACVGSKSPGDEFFSELMEAEKKGLGIRQGEGFGRIVISHRFHSNEEFQFNNAGGAQ